MSDIRDSAEGAAQLSAVHRDKLEHDYHAPRDQRQLPQWIADHLRRYDESPAVGHLWDGTEFGGLADTPTLLLTTTGRKTGRRITMPLIYGRDGDRYVLVGSNGGAPNHASWYLNLEANPRVDVQIVEDRFSAMARTVSGEERERLFAMMTAVYPPYPAYQARTERQIPIVALERVN